MAGNGRQGTHRGNHRPEQAIDRALDTYLKKGYSEEWIHQRLLAIRIRNELTDEWKKRGVQKGKEYAIQ